HSILSDHSRHCHVDTSISTQPRLRCPFYLYITLLFQYGLGCARRLNIIIHPKAYARIMDPYRLSGMMQSREAWGKGTRPCHSERSEESTSSGCTRQALTML